MGCSDDHQILVITNKKIRRELNNAKFKVNMHSPTAAARIRDQPPPTFSSPIQINFRGTGKLG